MSLQKLFESLDEKVFTADLKESMEKEFNEAVEAKATVIADERIEEEIDRLSEKSEEHIKFLDEKSEEYVELKESEMLEAVDKYLDRVVAEFLEEAEESLQESVKSEKADMIIEAFDSMLVATGVEVSRIAEAKKDSGEEGLSEKLKESTERYDSLVNENIELQEKNEKLIKMGVIAEMSEGLSLVEREKFNRLANLVEFSQDSAFADKLETIRESVIGSVSAPEKELEELEESRKETKPAWAHLI